QLFSVNMSCTGGMAEWSNAPVLKTGGVERLPRVRISLPPQTKPKQAFLFALTLQTL
ncbi:MAG: hypothetical protein RLY57_341, partial [Candidatus Parcubacteria bacterium]